MNNNLTNTNKNSKLILSKTKNLLSITKDLLKKKNSSLSSKIIFKPFLLEQNHDASISSISISPDGTTIVSGSEDDNIKIWDMKTGECIYTINTSYKVSINKDGYFTVGNELINKYLRVSEKPLTQRKLTVEEIKYFRKKNLLEINKEILN